MTGRPLRVQALLAVVRRPRLWATAWRQTHVLADPRWWRRPPFLPLPARDYLRFRLQTAYGGDGSGPIEPQHLIAYLEWCRTWRRSHLPESTTATGAAPVP